MKLKTRKQCSAHCDTMNKLEGDVARVFLRYSKKLKMAGYDPALLSLRESVEQAERTCTKIVRESLRRFWNEWETYDADKPQ
jgi:hypothetical protein